MSMITILTMLEEGYDIDSTFEHNAFQQLKGAYACKLISIPHDYATMQEGLDAAVGTKVFMMRPGRVAHSTEFKDWTPPDEDLVFVFGSPTESLSSFVGDEIALHITTPFDADMMAISVAGIVMYVHR